MHPLRFLGIPEHIATHVRTTMTSPQYGHPAYREVATGTGPCRLCLRTFEVGRDERILFTYQPFQDPGSLPAPGPVFIHAESCPRYEGPDLPPDFRSLPLVFEAFQQGGKLLARTKVAADNAERALTQAFEHSQADYVHIRNGKAGCFMARVEEGAP